MLRSVNHVRVYRHLYCTHTDVYIVATYSDHPFERLHEDMAPWGLARIAWGPEQNKSSPKSCRLDPFPWLRAGESRTMVAREEGSVLQRMLPLAKSELQRQQQKVDAIRAPVVPLPEGPMSVV